MSHSVCDKETPLPFASIRIPHGNMKLYGYISEYVEVIADYLMRCLNRDQGRAQQIYIYIYIYTYVYI